MFEKVRSLLCKPKYICIHFYKIESGNSEVIIYENLYTYEDWNRLMPNGQTFGDWYMININYSHMSHRY